MGEGLKLTRRRLLTSAATGAGAVLAAPYIRPARALAAARGGPGARGMNVLLFLADQDRAIQHFPAGWAAANLPGLNRLQQHGVTFNRAFTNACMCSPARSTLVTGYFPAQHGVKYTLEADMPAVQYPQVELPLDLPNLVSVASAAGYTPVYKGKWHLSKPEGSDWAPNDVGKYGFGRWNPKDAGANQDIPEGGGGDPNNDGRFMNEVGDMATGHEGVIQYLTSRAAKDQPFFLVVSLVNPHDVLFYPSTYTDAGYDDSWLQGDIDLPEMKVSDRYLVGVLDTLKETGLFDNTLVVRTADHGEMGLAHGGLRQKNFNVYEESIRVPLVYSNPRLFPKARTNDGLVSHVDFLPTLANLIGTPNSARADWQGRDYSSQVLRGPSWVDGQPYVVFTYDDFQAGQASGPYIPPPNHIVAIREQRWKLARYYDVAGTVPDEWEMYDLKNDPLETTSLADPGYTRTSKQQQEFKRLQKKLAKVEQTRLHPLV